MKVALCLTSSIALSYLVAISTAQAQIVPDNTLPENSRVTPGCTACTIDGGTVRGDNLFHSFSQFSIPTGGEAFFNNGLQIQNILSRVTGNSVSNINGLIRANGMANLFLLNPNGIVFGANASLNIGGSFLATTASSIRFLDGTEFSAIAPQPVLTVSVPIGLNFGTTTASITNQSTAPLLDSTGNPVLDEAGNSYVGGLQVPAGETLALVGGDVVLSGGYLTTAAGRIELGSVGGTGFVSLTPTETGYALGYTGVENLQDIHLSQSAIDASGDIGGSIQIQGRRVTLTDGSAIITGSIGTQNSGDISIQASQLMMEQGAFVAALTVGDGNGGNLSITAADRVEVTGSAQGLPTSLTTQTLAAGVGGKLTIATRNLVVADGANVTASTFSTGQGGTLEVNASETVRLSQGVSSIPTGLFAQSEAVATGDAGDLIVNTGSLIVENGAIASASTYGSGRGGTLRVNASQFVQAIGVSLNGQRVSRLSATTEGIEDAGDAGNLQISTGTLLVQGGGQILASTLGSGRGGSIEVNAPQSVEAIGRSADGEFGSLINATSFGTGDAGSIRITTGRLTVRDGAQIAASTSGSGDGGSIAVTAPTTVELVGTSTDGQFTSSLLARTLGSGDGGDVRISTGRLTIRDGAEVTVSSTETGNAGNLNVTAQRLSLDNNAQISASAAQAGGGDITINADDIRLNNNSLINTSVADSTGGGGNITVDANTFTALGDSDILANADAGPGGDITINSPAFVADLFGSDATAVSRNVGDFNQRGNDRVDISASSNVGISGSVTIPDFSYLQNSLSSLSGDLVSPDQIVANSCIARRNVKTGSFTVTGTGGLPRTPDAALSGRYSVIGVQPLAPLLNSSSIPLQSPTPRWKLGDPIVEAQSMVITRDGRILAGSMEMVAVKTADDLVCHPD